MNKSNLFIVSPLALSKNPSDYMEQITSQKAGRLTGKLLLIAGDVDDNVNPCMTMQLVDALIRADRPFDQLIMTNRNPDLATIPTICTASSTT